MASQLFYAANDVPSNCTKSFDLNNEGVKKGDHTKLSFEEIEKPLCRCDYVNNWLEKHMKYFPPPPPHLITQTQASQYTFGPSGEHYYYSAPLPAPPPRDLCLPYIMPAPFRISPMVPKLAGFSYR